MLRGVHEWDNELHTPVKENVFNLSYNIITDQNILTFQLQSMLDLYLD